jgi:hypothetical protein
VDLIGRPMMWTFGSLSIHVAKTLLEFGDMETWFTQGFLGALITLFGMILGRHLNNLRVGSHFIKE